jgi:hypothetical protein
MDGAPFLFSRRAAEALRNKTQGFRAKSKRERRFRATWTFLPVASFYGNSKTHGNWSLCASAPLRENSEVKGPTTENEVGSAEARMGSFLFSRRAAEAQRKKTLGFGPASKKGKDREWSPCDFYFSGCCILLFCYLQ